MQRDLGRWQHERAVAKLASTTSVKTRSACTPLGELRSHLEPKVHR